MNQIINVGHNGLVAFDKQQKMCEVNARNLHAALQVGNDFSTWIKGRIEKYKYVENRDFVIVQGAVDADDTVATEVYLPNFGEINPNNMIVQGAVDADGTVATDMGVAASGKQNTTDTIASSSCKASDDIMIERSLLTFQERTVVDMIEFDDVDGESFISSRVFSVEGSARKQRGRGGNNRIDYILTMDMAKQLTMLEPNDIGNQVRQYFIDVENGVVEAIDKHYKHLLDAKDAMITKLTKQNQDNISIAQQYQDAANVRREKIESLESMLDDPNNVIPYNRKQSMETDCKYARKALAECVDAQIELILEMRPWLREAGDLFREVKEKPSIVKNDVWLNRHAVTSGKLAHYYNNIVMALEAVKFRTRDIGDGNCMLSI